MPFEWGNHIETVFASNEHRRIAAVLTVPLTADGVVGTVNPDPHTPSDRDIVEAVLAGLERDGLVECFEASSPEAAIKHVADAEHLPSVSAEQVDGELSKADHFIANVHAPRSAKRHYHVDGALYVLTNKGLEAVTTAGGNA